MTRWFSNHKSRLPLQPPTLLEMSVKISNVTYRDTLIGCYITDIHVQVATSVTTITTHFTAQNSPLNIYNLLHNLPHNSPHNSPYSSPYNSLKYNSRFHNLPFSHPHKTPIIIIPVYSRMPNILIEDVWSTRISKLLHLLSC